MFELNDLHPPMDFEKTLCFCTMRSRVVRQKYLLDITFVAAHHALKKQSTVLFQLFSSTIPLIRHRPLVDVEP